ncbi:multiple sugar transport system permease protein [Paenibacillus sophorae]|uniref:Multiple sugar transport system permease protein n=1 Tax=Paenibacillus sophorae TaxID=1333845 RepID=A0A1H8KUA2_9BACL|nr:sugar ABC transporter permease [Paenibacillus sophorae]QWU17569.1 sugar ABC transporter permease [Paenibacillus sophorae]SEN96492.1 multiple sugar transport system permease protein [Paenibacillus sophorae]
MVYSEKAAKWVLSFPLLLFWVVMVVFPAGYAIYLSLHDVSMGQGMSSFSGFGNYLEILRDADFWHSIGFTLEFALITTVLELVFGFLLALLFNRSFPGKRPLLSMVLLPIMVAPSLMGIMFRLILNENNGVATYFLSLLHIQVNLFDPDLVVPLMIVLDIMQWVPFTFLIIYSGLQGVDPGLYEAASVDGASYWRTVLQIILPVIAPIFFIAAFLRGIDAFRTFDVIYVLTNGGPGNITKTASIYIYEAAFKSGQIGQAASASVIVAVFLLLLIPFFVKRLSK